MTAKDKDTGKQQGITISEGSNLDKSEIDRMVADAESNRADDQRIRQEVDARNELDSVAYQVERQLGVLGESVPAHEKARAEMLVSDARQAVQSQAPMDRVRSLTADLQQVLAGLAPPGAATPPARRVRAPETAAPQARPRAPMTVPTRSSTPTSNAPERDRVPATGRRCSGRRHPAPGIAPSVGAGSCRRRRHPFRRSGRGVVAERELEDRWRRSAADLDNLRKRAVRYVDRERMSERIRVNAAWLPVLDNLELALSYADDPDHLREGIGPSATRPSTS